MASGGQDLLVRAALDDAAAVDDEDGVGAADRRQPVGYDQRAAYLLSDVEVRPPATPERL